MFAQWRPLLLVFAGGVLGTACREAVTLVLPGDGGVPVGVLIVNLVGAFMLGFLVAALSWWEAETPVVRDMRLFVGTGLLGGFTTYSAFSTDTVRLLASQPGAGIGYAAVSIVAGIACAAAGLVLGGWLRRRDVAMTDGAP